MEIINTRKTNKNKNIKQQNQTTLSTNITQKTPELQGKQFFMDWKQSEKQDKNKNTKLKEENTKNNANIETERLKHTPWKQKQEQQKEKKKLPKMKAIRVSKRRC